MDLKIPKFDDLKDRLGFKDAPRPRQGLLPCAIIPTMISKRKISENTPSTTRLITPKKPARALRENGVFRSSDAQTRHG